MRSGPHRPASSHRLRTELRSFDGVDLAPLRGIAAKLRPEPAEISRMLGLLPCREDSIELGATWLVKNLLERAPEPLAPARSRRLVHRLMDCRLDWSRLHLLQALARARLGAATRRELEPVLWRWLDEVEHGFTRAWVYDALARTSAEDDRSRRRLLEHFHAAYGEERPAVRARLRHLIAALEARAQAAVVDRSRPPLSSQRSSSG